MRFHATSSVSHPQAPLKLLRVESTFTHSSSASLELPALRHLLNMLTLLFALFRERLEDLGMAFQKFHPRGLATPSMALVHIF
jgi:hypothetical protein